MEPHQRLAAGVLRQAIADRDEPGPVGTSARRFLAGSAGFHRWCSVLGVDPDAVTHGIARLDRSRRR